MGSGAPLAGIVRVSHMGTRKAGALSTHTDREQAADIEAACKRIQIPVRMLEPELDVSGLLPLNSRPVLLEGVEGTESGRFAGIAVAYLSRLGRNTRAQLEVWDRVEAAGGRVVVARDNIDTSTPRGRWMRTVMAAEAECEAEEHAERFEAMREWATTAGIWQRRQTPKGYDKDPETRRLVRNGDASDVAQAWRDRLAEVPISALARRLGMSAAGVRALLKNRVYLGELHVGRHVNLNAHPPICNDEGFPETFDAVQRLVTPRTAVNKPTTLLAGILRCRSCGHIMRKGSGGRGYTTYACHGQHSAGRCPATTSISAARIEEYIIPIALAELTKLKAHVAGAGRKIAAARKVASHARTELSAYLEGVKAAGIDSADWAAGARSRREAVEDAERALRTIIDRQPAAVDGDPLDHWEQMNTRQRNRLLRRLMECVIVTPVGRGKNVPVEQRVRAIAAGTGFVETYRGGGVALPIRQLPFPDINDPVVLRI